MKHFYTWFSGLVLASLFYACVPELEPPQMSLGPMRTQRMLAVGSSGVAGVANGLLNADQLPVGGLYAEAQQYAFPMLFARQVGRIIPLEFRSPALPDSGSGYQYIAGLRPAACENRTPLPFLRNRAAKPGWDEPLSNVSGYHNLGIPGLRLRDVERIAASQQNHYFRRFAGSNLTSYTSWMRQQAPTLSLVWLGLEDAMYYAMTGCYNQEEFMTDASRYEAHLEALLAELLQDPEALVLIGNIPDFTRFPFFSTVKPMYSDADCQKHPIYYLNAAGDVAVADEYTHILLPARTQIGTATPYGPLGLSHDAPLPGKLVIDPYEIDWVSSRIEQYNAAILAVAARYNQTRTRVAVVDLAEAFEQIQQGHAEGGIYMDGAYLSGGFFSLDGITCTPRGNAYIANTFLRTAQESWQGVQIPLIDLGFYPGLQYP